MKTYKIFAKDNDLEMPHEAPHRKLAYRAACESIVLLKNDGVLPVRTDAIALYGAGAAMTIKGGTGSGEVNERHSISIWEGMKKAGCDITTESWLSDYQKDYADGLAQFEKRISDSLKSLDIATYMNLFLQSYSYPFGRPITTEDVENSDTDTCIYVVARQSGEGHDRKLEEFMLSEEEREHIRFCTSHYEKTIVVLNVGSSFDVCFMDEIPGINALIYFCQQGSAGGEAFADIISGKVTPSGKLTDTWVRSYDDVPFGHEYSHLNGHLDNEDYKESIYVGYRYYDTFGVEPYFPFGYGLSYSQFNISYEHIHMYDGGCVAVTVRVTNTSDTFSGKEVVQLYASCPAGKLDKEYQRLVAFAKTGNLAPGESEELILMFPIQYLTSFNPDTKETLMEKGRYLLRIGSHSRNTQICAALDLTEDFIFEKHKEICPLKKPLDVLKSDNTLMPDYKLANDDILTITADMIDTVVHTYEDLPVTTNRQVLKQLKALKPHERIDLVVGAGLKDMLLNSSYVKVPGVAGNTTSKFVGKGIPNLALADGPAGIRVQRRFTITKNGTAKMIDMQFDMMKYLPNFVKKLFCGNEKTDKIYYQFTTAFPVANAMAQTWNEDLWIEMGNAIGEEMQTYGITFWLAPGVNIHRNPLCGRNYEYFSEDPILSGLIASAINNGVTSVPGRFVTLKHFAANNQEDNRNHVSSNVDERALREIYLKPFEIPVRESLIGSVMTSYNKLNGVYTSNSKDLLTHVLRNEWGFDGLVMTDWTTTAKGQSDPALCMTAGNDLIMPGSERDKKCIKKAVLDGSLSTRDVNRCAANVLQAIQNSAISIKD